MRNGDALSRSTNSPPPGSTQHRATKPHSPNSSSRSSNRDTSARVEPSPASFPTALELSTVRSPDSLELSPSRCSDALELSTVRSPDSLELSPAVNPPFDQTHWNYQLYAPQTH
ncbi:hypothetical protein TraAM80_10234, partial [Trypanosoma rangeli]